MLLMGKLTISMAIFNSFLYVHQAGYTSTGRILKFPHRMSAEGLEEHLSTHLVLVQDNPRCRPGHGHGDDSLEKKVLNLGMVGITNGITNGWYI